MSFNLKPVSNSNLVSKSGSRVNVYVIDFPAKALKDEFAGTPASREGIRGLLNYNSLNKITTYFDEKDVITNDYD